MEVELLREIVEILKHIRIIFVIGLTLWFLENIRNK